jgi:uncharacterized integral membrane protein (TIGR02327 family)
VKNILPPELSEPILLFDERSDFLGQFLGQQALIAIFSHLLFITLTWWALQGVHFEHLMKKGRVMQTKVLLLLITIAVGTSVSNFFLDYLSYSRSLTYFFK